MRHPALKSLSILGLLFSAAVAQATVSLPALFADHMVVQRDLPIHVWGKASPGEQVSVSFRAETKAAMADPLGHWGVYLSPAAAGGPYTLTIQGATSTVTLADVLVGDVWIASGQSNMEFPLRQVNHAEAEIAVAKFPRLRILRLKRAYSDYPLDDVAIEQPWSECTPATTREFSAVAYYFAKEIHETLKVPIGVIESSWGGTLAEAWTSMRTLSSDASLLPVFTARAEMMELQRDVPALRAWEQQQLEQARAAGQSSPKFAWHPEPYMWAPAALYNAMIAPLTPYAIRGVIWYQGESNSGFGRASLYDRLFPALIFDWRQQWAQGDFPFLFVQISSFESTPAEDWPTIRDAQRKTLALRNTAMAVTIDIGDPADVHPTNKRDVGHRLALAARAIAFGEMLEYSGPLFRQVTREEHALRIWFDHAQGLQAKGTEVQGFEIAAADGKFVPASARIEGSSVVVFSPSLKSPISVRYGWANAPQCNLFNRAGLPASPFRSDSSSY